jgi:hypothetical protein
MLQIPERYIGGLKKLRQLPEASFNELLTGISRIPLSSSRDRLTEEAQNFIPSIKPKDLEDLLSLLVSLKGAQEQAETSADFIEKVLSAISRIYEPVLELVGAERDTFKARLTTLLNADHFSISAKAISLLGEYEHTFCRARILTDFRPIYGNDPSKKPAAGMITHTLRLSYHAGTQLQHIYVLLDDSDLDEMKGLVSRAEIKAESLRAGLAITQVPLIGTREKRP